MIRFSELFFTFAKVGICTFGGGYAMLPMLQREVVEKKQWCTEEELADYFAIGQCTPGIIAVNTATFVGQKHRGVLGGVAATLGVVFPSAAIILALAAVLQSIAHQPLVVHAFAGVRACICALILSSVLKLGKNALTDGPAIAIFLVVLGCALAGRFAPIPADTLWGQALSFLLSPVVLVVCAGVAGLCVKGARGGRQP